MSEIVKLTLAGLFFLILQIFIAPLISISDVKPDILLIYVMVIAVTRGSYTGLAAGFLVGLLQDMASMGVLGVMALSKSSLAFWGGLWIEQRESSMSFWTWMLIIIPAALFQDWLSGLFLLQGVRTGLIEYYIFNSIPSAFYTGFLGLMFALSPQGSRILFKGIQSRTRRFSR